MIKKLILSSAITALLTFPNASFAFRCGSDLVSIGDLKNEVLLACGTPQSKEVIGYIYKKENGERIKVMQEEWIIETSNYYYSLVFEGNTLMKIEDAGRKK